MNLKTTRMMTLATVAGVFFGFSVSVFAESTYEAEQRQAAEARSKDPAWKPAFEQIALIEAGDGKQSGAVRNFCLNADGNILACYAPQGAKSSDPKKVAGIRVYSPKGELIKTMPLEIKPVAICVGNDGSIYAAGEGRLLKLDANGKVLASAASPVAHLPVEITKEMEEMIKESAKDSNVPYETEKKRMKESLEKRRADVTGLAVTSEDLFMAVPAPSDFTYRVYRFDQNLQNAKMVVEKLRGCCGQMDVQAHQDKLWIPHNARHTVESRDRDGKQLTKFGTKGKVKAADFGGCCEPKNMRVLANGEILAAESGPPTCIKRFSADGKFLGVLALLKDSKGDCVRVTVDVSPDGKRFYMLDTTSDSIRVFGPKS